MFIHYTLCIAYQRSQTIHYLQHINVHWLHTIRRHHTISVVPNYHHTLIVTSLQSPTTQISRTSGKALYGTHHKQHGRSKYHCIHTLKAAVFSLLSYGNGEPTTTRNTLTTTTTSCSFCRAVWVCCPAVPIPPPITKSDPHYPATWTHKLPYQTKLNIRAKDKHINYASHACITKRIRDKHG